MTPEIWSDLFILPIPLLEKIIRPILVYFFLVIGLRIAGKRELAQLNPFDLVVLLSLSNTVQNAIIGNDNSISGGIIGAATLLTINYLTIRFIYNHKKLDKILEGEEVTLIENGEVKNENLKKELLTMSELVIAAHRQGFSSLEEVEKAILEPGGSVSFIAKKGSPEKYGHAEILTRLDALTEEIKALRTANTLSN